MLEKIPGTGLETVLNTASDLFRHGQTGRYYLRYGEGWLTAADLTGAWVASAALPADFRKLPNKERWTEVKKSVPGKPLPGADVPEVLDGAIS